MANCAEHVTIGFIAGVGTYLGLRLLTKTTASFGEAVLAGLISAGGAAAPDLIEPAVHPNHRSFAHSLLAGGSIAKGLHSLHRPSVQLAPEERFVAFFLGVGYLSHLFLDGRTPRGLPLVG